MANFTLSLTEILRRSFGDAVPNFDINKPQKSANPAFNSIGGSSSFASIFQQVEIEAGSYFQNKTQYFYKAVTLPITTFVDLSRAKTIVETAVIGRSGTVKELIGSEDWRITIRGVLTPGCLTNSPSLDAQNYPFEEVLALNNLANIPASLAVNCELFNQVGIDSIVIKSISLPSLDGYPSVQPFSLECVSDYPFELQAITQILTN